MVVSTKMRLSSTLQLLLVLCTCHTALGRHAKSVSPCFEQSCNLIRGEVESLARLKIIRTYVTETMRLMDTLMTSMDEELVKMAEQVRQTGGDHCPNLPSPLDYIIQKDPNEQEEEENMEQLLGAGIEQNVVDRTGEAVPTSHYDAVTSQNTNSYNSLNERDQRSENTWPSGNSNNYAGNGWNSGRSVDSDGRWTTEQGGRTESGLSHQTSGGWLSQRTDRTSNSYNPQRSETTDNNWPSRGQEVESDNFDSREDVGQTAEYSSSDLRTESSSSNSNRGSGWRPIPTRRNCRGATNSPFRVPGIDSWCAENCSRGYCPESHCTCD